MFDNMPRRIVSGKTASLIMALTFVISIAPAKDVAVAPPNAKVHGLSYGEWGAEWWKWVFLLPVHDGFGNVTHPGLSTGPVDCGYGQSQHPNGNQVWFLIGTFGGDPVARECVVPTGVALFFPMLNIAWDNVDPSNPPNYIAQPGLGLEGLKAVAAEFVEGATALYATVNGQPIVSDLGPYRAKFSPFSYKIPDDNLYNLWFGIDMPEQTIEPAVTDGYWLMLRPLPPGTYIVKFGGISNYMGASFAVDITYKITVVQRPLVSLGDRITIIQSDWAEPRNRTGDPWSTVLTVANTSVTNNRDDRMSAIPGPIQIVPSELSPNARLLNATGVTPDGTPYITITQGPLVSGASASAALQFLNSTGGAITFKPEAYLGPL